MPASPGHGCGESHRREGGRASFCSVRGGGSLLVAARGPPGSGRGSAGRLELEEWPSQGPGLFPTASLLSRGARTPCSRRPALPWTSSVWPCHWIGPLGKREGEGPHRCSEDSFPCSRGRDLEPPVNREPEEGSEFGSLSDVQRGFPTGPLCLGPAASP